MPRARLRTLAVGAAGAAVLIPMSLAGTALGGKEHRRHGVLERELVATASSNASFSTLVSLVQQAGLVGALSGKDRLTVPAPTNAAFAKVPKATLDTPAAGANLLRRVLTLPHAAG